MAGQPPSSTAGKPIRCKAAVARKAGEPLTIEQVIVAPPKPHEVRIKIICTSLCHTDLTFWKLNEPPSVFPVIFGHEAVGVIESVGEGVKEVGPGDYVIPAFLADCGECNGCRNPKGNICSVEPFNIVPYMPRDKTSRFTDLNGEVIHHFVNVSSFTEYTVIDVTHVAKVNPAIPPNRACLIGCGISTGVGAAWKAGGVEKGSTVVVFGLDYCFECVGMASLVHEAYASSKSGSGKTVVLGVDKPTSNISFNSIDMLFTGKTVRGSLFGGLKTKTDVPILVEWYLEKKMQLDEFVTHEMKIEDINEAMKLLIEGKCLRCVMWMD
ncbi:hypothetical protein V2J09_017303 [Rumex salicifolius]